MLALVPALAPPLVEQPLLLDLATDFFLLEHTLPLKFELPAHVGVGSGLCLLLAAAFSPRTVNASWNPCTAIMLTTPPSREAHS